LYGKNEKFEYIDSFPKDNQLLNGTPMWLQAIFDWSARALSRRRRAAAGFFFC
jgi:hypothetical protein